MQQGVVGQIVGQKVAEAKLGGFLESGAIDGLPDDEQAGALPGRRQRERRPSGRFGAQALGAIEQTRQTAQSHLDKQIANVPALVESSPALQDLQAVVNTKLDVADLQHAARERGRTSPPSRTAFRAYIPPTHIIFPPIVRPGP